MLTTPNSNIPAAKEAKAPFEPLLTAEEAACHLRIHVKTLLRLAREGVAPGIRMGKYWRFRLSSLDLWVAQQQTGCSQPLS
jgi:excisionase family DNA binding protein